MAQGGGCTGVTWSGAGWGRGEAGGVGLGPPQHRGNRDLGRAASKGGGGGGGRQLLDCCSFLRSFWWRGSGVGRGTDAQIHGLVAVRSEGPLAVWMWPRAQLSRERAAVAGQEP